MDKAKEAMELFSAIWYEHDYIEERGNINNLIPDERLFLKQIIAIAACHNSKINLERVIALLLLRGLETISEGFFEILEPYVKRNQWLNGLIQELQEGKSEEYKFASKVDKIVFEVEVIGGRGVLTWDDEFGLGDNEDALLQKAAELLDVERAGWVNWGISLDEGLTETIPIHIISSQTMALTIGLVFEKEYADVNLEKVFLMLPIGHLVGETPVTGKKTSKADEAIAIEKFCELIKTLQTSYPLESLFSELYKCKTHNANFARQSGKSCTDFQAWIFEDLVDVEHQENNPAMGDELVKRLFESTHDFLKTWFGYSRAKWGYDKNFLALLDAIESQ